jgi:hypothetical protein
MPNRWAIASGNWNNPAIWNGGSGVPTAADDVFANSQSIYINIDITVLTLRNAASASAIVAAGSFYLNNNITASTTAATGLVSSVANIPLIIISGSNSARINTIMGASSGHRIQMNDSSSLTLSGSVFGGNSSGQFGIIHASSGNLFITGSVTAGGSNTNQLAVYMSGTGGTYILGNVIGSVGACFRNDGSGEIVINGNVTAGNFGGGFGIVNAGNGNITVYGNLIANANTPISNTGNGNIFVSGTIVPTTNAGLGIGNSGLGNITVVGVVSGSTAASAGAVGISNTSLGTIQITGSVVGVRSAAISTTGDLYVTGSVTAGIAAAGITTTAARTYIIRGPISASIGAVGFSSTSTSAVNLFTGPFYNTGSFNAVYAYRMQVFNQPTRWTFDTEVPGVQKTLTTIESITGAPVSSDVRQGVAYGLNGNLTGSLIIPDSSTVRSGVIVDTATGSAVFTAQDMFNVLTQNITTPGSIGELLTRASTVQTAGATISTFRI